MTLLDMRLTYEAIKSSWRSRPPSEHHLDLARLRELKAQAAGSEDDGTSQLAVEIDDLMAQIGNQGKAPHAPAVAPTFLEPSDAM